ncbi:uncharacterized protein [Callorhinus ursinus]|uniref:uncharacterized protein n=1 Tax=Callorhinus ursinus TaxID=34884 RepID=UPI003CCFF5D5
MDANLPIPELANETQGLLRTQPSRQGSAAPRPTSARLISRKRASTLRTRFLAGRVHQLLPEATQIKPEVPPLLRRGKRKAEGVHLNKGSCVSGWRARCGCPGGHPGSSRGSQSGTLLAGRAHSAPSPSSHDGPRGRRGGEGRGPAPGCPPPGPGPAGARRLGGPLRWGEGFVLCWARAQLQLVKKTRVTPEGDPRSRRPQEAKSGIPTPTRRQGAECGGSPAWQEKRKSARCLKHSLRAAFRDVKGTA